MSTTSSTTQKIETGLYNESSGHIQNIRKKGFEIMAKDNTVKQQFIEMRAKGLSFNTIAKELGVSKNTLIEWSREYENDINNLKTIELEALQEHYLISKKKRIELFGEQAKAIIAELDSRGLKDVPTEKLYGILFKTTELLKAEETPITLSVIESRTDELMRTMENKVTTWSA